MKNIFSKIIAALVGLLSFIALFVPQLAFADDLSSFFLGASMGGVDNYNKGYDDGYRQASGIKYSCKFVDENGKTVKSDIFYDNMTLGYVTKLLDDENNNIKNIKDGEFKPSKKALSCHKDPDSVDYDVTPIMFTCRTLDNKNRVLETKNYNVIQSLNKTEQIDAENAKIASHKANSTNNLSKKRFQCVNVGETYDIFDGKAENNAKHSQQTDAWSHIKNVSKFTEFGIIAFIASIIVIAIIPLMHLKTYKK